MADDLWQSRSHGEIVKLLSELSSDAAHEESLRWDNVSTAVSDSIDTAMAARKTLLDDKVWDGAAAEAAYKSVDDFYKEAADPETGLAAEAGKISQAALQDGETLIAASRVAQNYPELGSGAPTERKKEELEAIRAEAQRMYTSPLSSANRPEITDGTENTQLGPLPGGNVTGTSGGNTGTGGRGETPQSPSSAEGLADRKTKPQLAGGDGQQGAGGQGQGQGGGSGGGTPGGGTGGGAGAGSGFGSGAKDPATGLPVGSTTAAGLSPSATGAGAGTGVGTGGPGGLSALRGGSGIPGGVAGGTSPGVNPAALGATGVRGIGGPMGMMGGAGAHGKGGKGDDDEHQPSEILLNYDNTDELLGDLPPASPAVIGDFDEVEQFAKQKQEREIRRYKSLGWDVKFE